MQGAQIYLFHTAFRLALEAYPSSYAMGAVGVGRVIYPIVMHPVCEAGSSPQLLRLIIYEFARPLHTTQMICVMKRKDTLALNFVLYRMFISVH